MDKRPWWGKFVGGGGSGGGGGGRGGSGGSGNGRGRGEEPDEIDPDSGRSWDEAKQIAYAFFGLLFVVSDATDATVLPLMGLGSQLPSWGRLPQSS